MVIVLNERTEAPESSSKSTHPTVSDGLEQENGVTFSCNFSKEFLIELVKIFTPHKVPGPLEHIGSQSTYDLY